MKPLFSWISALINHAQSDYNSFKCPIIWSTRAPTSADITAKNGLSDLYWWFDCDASVMWVFTTDGWVTHKSVRDSIKKERNE